MLTRGCVAVGLGFALLVAGCGGDEKGEAARTATSPVSHEPRDTGKQTSLAPLIVSPVEPAVPFRGSDGKVLVSYELRLHNATPLTLAPARVRVWSPDGRAIEKLDRRQVTAALALPGARSGVRELHEGQLATLYLTLRFDDRSAIPDRLVHRISVEAPRLPGGRAVSSPTTVRVLDAFDVPVLGPPLEPARGYVAADSCCSSVRHRRGLLAIGNRQWLAQRFAVDWEQVDATRRFVKRGGNPARPADYTIYGAQAIAAADATIVDVIDGLPAQRPGALPQGITLREADGNSVIAKIDGGLYMLYAHLQAGSLRVKAGDKVKRGDPLGLVGNSGNSSAPHLHFHVMDGPSPLTSEGVPYEIDAFATRGRLRSTAVFDKYENTTRPFDILPFAGADRNRAQMPLDLTVVDFR
ncbi:MAG TPA: M23 family metallopeptidase [Solirubrobacteraceae bacterium]|nr:M23 family metallopeptidase [Solirubrobacteraceae bacterium]